MELTDSQHWADPGGTTYVCRVTSHATIAVPKNYSSGSLRLYEYYWASNHMYVKYSPENKPCRRLCPEGSFEESRLVQERWSKLWTSQVFAAVRGGQMPGGIDEIIICPGGEDAFVHGIDAERM